jgi:hypothetical protein
MPTSAFPRPERTRASLAGIPDTGKISWASFLKVIDGMLLPFHPTDAEMDANIAKIDTRAEMVLIMWKKKGKRASNASQPAVSLPSYDGLLNPSQLNDENSSIGIKNDSKAGHIRKRLADDAAIAQGDNVNIERD